MDNDEWWEALDLRHFHRCPIKAGCICDDSSSLGEGTMIREEITAEQFDWSFADTAICICLEGNDDRLQSSAAEFHRVGLCRKVLYYRPKRPSKEVLRRHRIGKPGKYGCWESHRFVGIVARKVLKSRRNLVFEDDVKFLNTLTPSHLQVIASHFTSDTLADERWDVYYLGHLPNWNSIKITDTLWRVNSVLLHAYVQSGSFMDRLVTLPWIHHGRRHGEEETLDEWVQWNAIQYAASPMVALQGPFQSDIQSGPKNHDFLNQKTIGVVEPFLLYQKWIYLFFVILVICLIAYLTLSTSLLGEATTFVPIPTNG